MRAVEGYGGGRLINPDKWFHWKLLSVTETAYFVDNSLFAYRWHPSNQTALQEATERVMKYLVDEYVSTLEIDADLLKSVNLTRDEFIAGFRRARHCPAQFGDARPRAASTRPSTVGFWQIGLPDPGAFQSPSAALAVPAGTGAGWPADRARRRLVLFLGGF